VVIQKVFPSIIGIEKVETLLHSISTEREAREFTWIGIR
jgi:hypothetical protein